MTATETLQAASKAAAEALAGSNLEGVVTLANQLAAKPPTVSAAALTALLPKSEIPLPVLPWSLTIILCLANDFNADKFLTTKGILKEIASALNISDDEATTVYNTCKQSVNAALLARLAAALDTDKNQTDSVDDDSEEEIDAGESAADELFGGVNERTLTDLSHAYGGITFKFQSMVNSGSLRELVKSMPYFQNGYHVSASPNAFLRADKALRQQQAELTLPLNLLLSLAGEISGASATQFQTALLLLHKHFMAIEDKRKNLAGGQARAVNFNSSAPITPSLFTEDDLKRIKATTKLKNTTKRRTKSFNKEKGVSSTTTNTNTNSNNQAPSTPRPKRKGSKPRGGNKHKH